MSEIKITYRGWPGHFIAAHGCSFRLNTLVEFGDVRAVVSTVGGYVPSGAKEMCQIGHDRFYETMAFGAYFKDDFWEADVRNQIDLQCEWAIGYPKADNEATKMHADAVAEVVKRMEDGETFTPKEEEDEEAP